MSTLRLYTKQALSISEQIELLKSRGLNIADSSKTAKFLGEVSYFRFVQYLRPMEADKTSHQFKPNSRFEDAVALYNFDMDFMKSKWNRIVEFVEHYFSTAFSIPTTSRGARQTTKPFG